MKGRWGEGALSLLRKQNIVPALSHIDNSINLTYLCTSIACSSVASHVGRLEEELQRIDREDKGHTCNDIKAMYFFCMCSCLLLS